MLFIKMLMPLLRAKRWKGTSIINIIPAHFSKTAISVLIIHLLPEPGNEVHGGSMALRYAFLNAKPSLNRVGWNEGFRQGSDTLSGLVYFIFIFLGCNSSGSSRLSLIVRIPSSISADVTSTNSARGNV